MTRHANEDSDTLIESAVNITTMLVGDDTDLLVWLLHHVKQRLNGGLQLYDIFFKPEPKKICVGIFNKPKLN